MYRKAYELYAFLYIWSLNNYLNEGKVLALRVMYSLYI